MKGFNYCWLTAVKKFSDDQMMSCISASGLMNIGSRGLTGANKVSYKRTDRGPLYNDKCRADQLRSCTSPIGPMLNAHDGLLSETQRAVVHPMFAC